MNGYDDRRPRQSGVVMMERIDEPRYVVLIRTKVNSMGRIDRDEESEPLVVGKLDYPASLLRVGQLLNQSGKRRADLIRLPAGRPIPGKVLTLELVPRPTNEPVRLPSRRGEQQPQTARALAPDQSLIEREALLTGGGLP